MEEIIKQVFTLYGPLGLGWVAWFFEMRRNVARDQRESDHRERMATILEGLKNAISSKRPR